MHRLTRPFATRALGSRRSRRTVAVLTTLALAAGLAGITGANATTSIVPAPSETNASGAPIVRNDSITLNTDKGGHMYGRFLSSQNFSLVTSSLLVSCKGNNPAAGGKNDSPRTEIVVSGPNGALPKITSPARALNLAGGEGAISNPQPPTGDGVYLGGNPWTATQSLAGLPAGLYTVTTTIIDKVKTGSGACATGTPNRNPTTGALLNSFSAGPVVETSQFEYRPWQQKFTDLLGTGVVQMNTAPKEFQFDVSGLPSPIIGAADSMKLYSLPNGASFSLDVPNPGGCGTDPLGCLPHSATTCDPATGCVPRLVTINHQGQADKLTGLFDIETKAFAAVATTHGHTRVLLSGGTELDATLHGLLDQLNEMAAGLGIDLPALLGTMVDLNIQRPDGSTDVIRISVLRMIEIFNVANGPATGVNLLAPVSVGAGVITHIGQWLSQPAPINPALHDAAGDHSGYGYTVTEATALPALPSLPAPLNALVPAGKLKHITGKIPANSGGHIVAIGVDTDYDATSGLPLHLPLASTPGLVPDSGIDFVGSATVLLNTELCIPGLGCFGGAAMLGTGVATFGKNPLPVNLGSLPLVWGDELGLGAAMAPVDGLVSDLTQSVLTNPAVTDLLGQVTGLLPGLPVPGLPGGTPGGGTGGGLPGLPGGLPVGNLPVGNLPVGNLPVGNLPLGSLPVNGLLGLPLGNLPLNNLPISNLLGSLPLASLLQIF